MEKLDLSIVAPLFNEAGNVTELIKQVEESLATTAYRWELILVNDGSTDATWRILQSIQPDHPALRCLDMAGNHGQTLALRAGFEVARGEVIIAMDGDLQHDPAYIPEFMRQMEQGYDLVGGYKESSPDSPVKRHLARLAHAVIARISGVDMRYFGATFKAYRRYLLEDINLLGDMHRFLGAIVIRRGVRFTEIPIQIRARGAGNSSYSLSKTFGVLVDLLFLLFALNYMKRPFRLFGMIGGVITLAGLGVASFFTLGSLFFDFNVKEDHLAEFLTGLSALVVGLLIICFGLVAELISYTYHAKGINAAYRLRDRIGPSTNDD